MEELRVGAVKRGVLSSDMTGCCPHELHLSSNFYMGEGRAQETPLPAEELSGLMAAGEERILSL